MTLKSKYEHNKHKTVFIVTASRLTSAKSIQIEWQYFTQRSISLFEDITLMHTKNLFNYQMSYRHYSRHQWNIYFSATCSHTNYEVTPWIQIYLHFTHVIQLVKIIKGKQRSRCERWHCRIVVHCVNIIC